jgi:hypothetical protein
VPQLTVSKLLNHSVPGVTDKHYDRHTYDAEKRHAVAAWDAHLQRLMGAAPAAANLVPFALPSP